MELIEGKAMTYTREVSVEWVKRCLIDELRETAAMGTRAENLVAVAEMNAIPIEELVLWIHCRTTDKQWSAAEWRRYCQKVVEARSQQQSLLDVRPEAFD